MFISVIKDAIKKLEEEPKMVFFLLFGSKASMLNIRKK